MNARRADSVAFWLFVAIASGMAALLGSQLASTDLPVSTFVFAVVSSWTGMYLGLDHLYAAFRRAKAGAR